MTGHTPNVNITGHQVHLDEKRSVFVGRNEAGDGLTYIKFVNAEGEETRLKISQDARDALLKLLSNDGLFTHGGDGVWRSVGETP